ncbi:hypothetical protein [Tistlia consotensis]|uniref:hypothetical protein n=1 Tax=Tistlia consotensis TaxID=1321365 RepID=UPI00117CE07B|nr:hypothetical protein [Tistlia consotensis]
MSPWAALVWFLASIVVAAFSALILIVAVQKEGILFLRGIEVTGKVQEARQGECRLSSRRDCYSVIVSSQGTRRSFDLRREIAVGEPLTFTYDPENTERNRVGGRPGIFPMVMVGLLLIPTFFAGIAAMINSVAAVVGPQLHRGRLILRQRGRRGGISLKAVKRFQKLIRRVRRTTPFEVGPES